MPKEMSCGRCARQAFRVVRERTDAKTGATSTETAYGISCVLAARDGSSP